jgi:hypothetical protein
MACCAGDNSLGAALTIAAMPAVLRKSRRPGPFLFTMTPSLFLSLKRTGSDAPPSGPPLAPPIFSATTRFADPLLAIHLDLPGDSRVSVQKVTRNPAVTVRGAPLSAVILPKALLLGVVLGGDSCTALNALRNSNRNSAFNRS